MEQINNSIGGKIMTKSRTITMSLIAIMVSVSLVACGSEEKNPMQQQQEPPPTFSMASVNVTCNDGSDCIQFSARPSKDVVLVKVVITPPAGNQITFNLNNTTFVSGFDVAVQDANFAYFRISGTWRFEFTGSLATGDKSSFTVSSTVNVGA
jgi:hypothetical protein